MKNTIMFGIYGYSNTGKTNLITKLISYYSQKNVKVATIKKTNKAYIINTAGKDTYRYAESGSNCNVFSSKNETVFFIKDKLDSKMIVEQLLNLEKYDMIFIEGAKEDYVEKIRIGSHPLRKNTILTYDNNFNKLISIIDKKIKNECDKMTDDIKLKINGKKIPLTDFPKDFIKNTLVGMVKSLKGVEKVEELEIYFKM